MQDDTDLLNKSDITITGNHHHIHRKLKPNNTIKIQKNNF